jgi:SOS-response transcriptional repressor LexA
MNNCSNDKRDFSGESKQMENLQDKIAKALDCYCGEQHKNNRSAAARALGLNNSVTLNHWINKTRAPGVDALQPVIDALGWKLMFPDEKLSEYELIPKTSARAGAGSSHLIEDETEGLYAFRKDFLSSLRISKNSVLLDVMGDSMEPTLRNGDTILIDRSDREVHDGLIYLVGFQQQLLVKRLFRDIAGLVLRSDNAAYRETLIPPEYMDDFTVFGRMRWMARTF